MEATWLVAAAGRRIVMLGQQRHARERLIADLTAISLDSCVRLQVRSQVRPVSKGTITV